RARITQILLSAGAYVDARDDVGQTPLWYACLHELYSPVRVLLQAGAHPVDGPRCPPSTVIKLLQHPDPFEAVAALLKEGGDVNAADEHGDTLLHHAARLGSPLLVKALLQASANPVLYSRTGQCVLHHALSLVEQPGGTEAVASLIAASADVDAKDILGHTPLYEAAKRGSASAAITALAKAGNINAKHEGCCTPLCMAVCYGKPTAVLLLMRLGADPTMPCSTGHIALHHAAKLIDHPAGEEAITALARAGGINVKDRDGCTPLCMASRGGKSFAVLLLLRLGAD
ncbi:hypothetical protein BOTBODRAFT_83549, partial [Botryobasidium botryosum FD-172 SS1]